MNEQLKAIAVKAKVEHCVSHVRLEEFAMLIVEECIEVFSKDLPEQDSGKMLEVVNRVCDVAEHFGVKNEQT